MEAKDISVVIPVYNSQDSIEEVVNRIIKSLGKISKSFEIILVNDFSLDKSLERLIDLENNFHQVRIINLNKNHGQQGAIKIGMKKAKGDYIVTIDDDLQHQPEDLKFLRDKIEEGYDLVYGVYNKENYSLYRKLGSKLVDSFFTYGLGKPKDIKVGSYRIINRRIVDKILKDKTPFVYITAISLKFTRNIGNVKVDHKKRKYGQSNYSFLKLIKLFFNLFFYYKILPIFTSNEKKIKTIKHSEEYK